MRSPPSRGRPGFTLLEILVVLVLVSLTGALTLPAAARWLDASRERGLRDELQALLAAAPLRAASKAEPLSLDAAGIEAELAQREQLLPEGWSVQLRTPLRYGAQGLAEGGELVLQAADGRRFRWQVEPVTGRVLTP